MKLILAGLPAGYAVDALIAYDHYYAICGTLLVLFVFPTWATPRCQDSSAPMFDPLHQEDSIFDPIDSLSQYKEQPGGRYYSPSSYWDD